MTTSVCVGAVEGRAISGRALTSKSAWRTKMSRAPIFYILPHTWPVLPSKARKYNEKRSRTVTFHREEQSCLGTDSSFVFSVQTMNLSWLLPEESSMLWFCQYRKLHYIFLSFLLSKVPRNSKANYELVDQSSSKTYVSANSLYGKLSCVARHTAGTRAWTKTTLRD